VRNAARFFTLPARAKAVALTVGVDPALPRLVLLDEQRLLQTVNNLLSNGLKFVAEGGGGRVELDVTVRRRLRVPLGASVSAALAAEGSAGDSADADADVAVLARRRWLLSEDEAGPAASAAAGGGDDGSARRSYLSSGRRPSSASDDATASTTTTAPRRSFHSAGDEAAESTRHLRRLLSEGGSVDAAAPSRAASALLQSATARIAAVAARLRPLAPWLAASVADAIEPPLVVPPSPGAAAAPAVVAAAAAAAAGDSGGQALPPPSSATLRDPKAVLPFTPRAGTCYDVRLSCPPEVVAAVATAAAAAAAEEGGAEPAQQPLPPPPPSSSSSSYSSGSLPHAAQPAVTAEPTEDVVLVAISCADNGCGMGAEDLRRLFKPFVQVDAGENQKGKGTGLGEWCGGEGGEGNGGACVTTRATLGDRRLNLTDADPTPLTTQPSYTAGLAISRELCQKHGGDITVTSAPGAGSTFTVLLPLRVLRLPPTAQVQEQQVQAVQAADTSADAAHTINAPPHAAAEQPRPGALPALPLSPRRVVPPVAWSDDAPLPRQPQLDSNDSGGTARTGASSVDRRSVLPAMPPYFPAAIAAASGSATEAATQPAAAAAPGTLHHQATTAAAASAEADAADRDGAAVLAACRPVHVLVVDDQAANRRLLARALLRQLPGAVVDEAADGQQAVDAVAARGPGHYDAITMDKQMPVLDGHAATVALRAPPLGYRGLVVGVTANAMPDDVSAFVGCGASLVLTKPVHVAALAAHIRAAHEARVAGAAGEAAGARAAAARAAAAAATDRAGGC
jgi:CheY-like chemotaxis protein